MPEALTAWTRLSGASRSAAVYEPAGRLGTEADQPAAAAEQKPQRAERSPRGERRQRGCRIVLLRVGPVHSQCREEREAETYLGRPPSAPTTGTRSAAGPSVENHDRRSRSRTADDGDKLAERPLLDEVFASPTRSVARTVVSVRSTSRTTVAWTSPSSSGRAITTTSPISSRCATNSIAIGRL
jgi:hypothetical protein